MEVPPLDLFLPTGYAALQPPSQVYHLLILFLATAIDFFVCTVPSAST